MNLYRNHPSIRAFFRSEVVIDKYGSMYHMSVKRSLAALYRALDGGLV